MDEFSYCIYWIWLSLYGFNNIIITLQSIYRTRRIVSFHQGLMTIMRFLFAILFIKIFGSSSEAAMYGQFIGLFLVLFSQYYFLKSTLKKKLLMILIQTQTLTGI